MYKKILVLTFLFFVISIVSFSQTSSIKGRVLDSQDRESLPGVAIVVSGTGIGTTTDFDGNFTLKIDSGEYDLEFSFISYKLYVIKSLVLKPGENKDLGDVLLDEDGFLLSEVVVTARQVKDTEMSLVAMKRNSINVLDGISAAAFKKIGDSDAASSMKRVSGVSVTGGKYVFVRGLGDRYTKTLLNGVEIPGLDPDRNTIQMDLFPTNMIDNIVVSKTFSAEYPADFTGGVINIQTKDFPETKQLSVNLGTSFNPASHFNKDFLTYEGASPNFFGFNNDIKKFPVENDQKVPFFAHVLGDPDGAEGLLYRKILNEFNPIMAASRKTSFLDYNCGLNYGNNFQINKYNFGINFALSYKKDVKYYKDAVDARYALNSELDEYKLDRQEYQKGDIGHSSEFISGQMLLALKKGDSKYQLGLMHIQNGVSRAGIFDFEKTSGGTNFIGFTHTLDYTHRQLTNVILSGNHKFLSSKLNWEWKLSPTLSSIDDPDIRFVRYRVSEGDELKKTYIVGTEAGFPERIWRKLFEYNISALNHFSYDYTLFDTRAKLNFGNSITYKNRDYSLRKFSISTKGFDLVGDPNELFEKDHLWNGEDMSKGTIYNPSFLPINSNMYNSSVQNFGFYASTELNPLYCFKAIVGLRLEKYTQKYTGRDQTGKNILNDDVVLDEFKLFPNINLIYALTERQNLRMVLSKTIARPSFKELSYSEIFDPISGRWFMGGLHPEATDVSIWDGNLRSADIYNADLRWEFFMASGQLFSASAFYKYFVNPIELIPYAIQPGAYQPRNVGNGQILGAEFEIRKNLKFIHEKLSSLYFSSNYTIAESMIKLEMSEKKSRLDNARKGEEISNYRVMADQAPYILNLGLSFEGESGFWKRMEMGLYYNVQGKTLMYAGISDRPGIYSLPFHSLNFNSNINLLENNCLSIGIKVDNILGNKQESVYSSFKSNDELFTSRYAGRVYNLKIVYKIVNK